MIDRRQVLAGTMALTAMPVMRAAAQQKTEITLSRQPGILYMPTHIIEKNQLIEKHAARLGVPGVTTKWLNFNSGGAQQDSLLSGNVDLINTGTGQLLLMWDRTKGGVKAVTASSAAPLVLVSRDPKIKTLSDFTEGDRIAVPTIKISTQSILLQLAATKLFGPDQWAKFDPFTVQMGHPDAYIALRNTVHEVKNHFAAPPFHHYALKNVPGAHVVTTSTDIIGGPLSQAQFLTTTKFADANPKIIVAVRAASEEAKALIETDTKGSVGIYKEITGDKTAVEDILELLGQPGMMEWNLYPQGTMVFATHLHRIGSLKTLPTSWKDYYLPIAHDLPGN
jgi:NitT/TauT family transport system substrate-binding protein